MPRFYFHLTNGKDTLTDVEGVELADAREARSMAVSHGASVIRRQGPIVLVADKLGVLVDAVPFVPALERDDSDTGVDGHRIRQWQDWFGSIEEIVAAGYYEIEPNTGAFNCSAGFRRVMGLPDMGPVSLRDVLRIFPRPARRLMRDSIARAHQDGDRFDLELETLATGTGSPLVRVFGLVNPSSRSGPSISGVCADIANLRRLEAGVWHAKHHDRLTGLPNRQLFHQRLEATLAEAKASKTKVGVLLIDLDHLKDINTRLGTSSGDEALRIVGEAISRSAGGAQWVARVGEDEFGVIVPDLLGAAQAELIGNGICSTIGRRSADNPVSCSVTVGVAVFPDHGSLASDLLEDAEIALTRAKASRNNRVVPFLREMRSSWERRLDTLEHVRAALADDRIFPFYQPKVSLTTGRTLGFEALLRWRHPKRGIQLPGTIIEAFEDVELSGQLSQRMQERVLADILRWTQSSIPFGRIALNASPTELREGGYADALMGRLDRAGIEPEKIEVEVTENAFVGQESSLVAAELRRLSEGGVTIALDDFGTGYGSLTHLRQFPVDVVKIDRSFTMDIGPSPNAELIVQAVINLANSLEIEVVSEGVETAAQAQFLIDCGCEVAQGFLFSKALPAVSVPAASRRNWSVGCQSSD